MHAFSTRGKTRGTRMIPHRFADGCYVVSKSRFEADYVRVRKLADVERYVRDGYGVRMSATGTSGRANLYMATSITL